MLVCKLNECRWQITSPKVAHDFSFHIAILSLKEYMFTFNYGEYYFFIDENMIRFTYLVELFYSPYLIWLRGRCLKVYMI